MGDDDMDTFLTTYLANLDNTGTSITPADPSTDQFDFDKFQFILNDEKTYHNPDDTMKETTNPVIEMTETDIETSQPSAETSQPSVETSQPCVEVHLHTCEVFVPEVNISFTVPVLQRVAVTDRTSPDMD